MCMCETASEPDREACKIKFRNFVISLASSSVLERFNRKEKIWVEEGSDAAHNAHDCPVYLLRNQNNTVCKILAAFWILHIYVKASGWVVLCKYFQNSIQDFSTVSFFFGTRSFGQASKDASIRNLDPFTKKCTNTT